MTRVEVEEEKPVCRVCRDVCEEKNRMNMGCSCKGQLGTIHEECAIRWFLFKGNNKCEVCNKEVSNLTIRSLPWAAEVATPLSTVVVSWWKVFIILLTINTTIYLAFIALVDFDLEAKTLVILWASCFVFTLVSTLLVKEGSWLYACIEFVFDGLFYSDYYTSFHLNPIYILMIAAISCIGLDLLLNGRGVQL